MLYYFITLLGDHIKAKDVWLYRLYYFFIVISAIVVIYMMFHVTVLLLIAFCVSSIIRLMVGFFTRFPISYTFATRLSYFIIFIALI